MFLARIAQYLQTALMSVDRLPTLTTISSHCMILVFGQSDPSTTALPCSYNGTGESIRYRTLGQLE